VGTAPFIAVLTMLIALAALAQTRGASQPSGKSLVVSGSPGMAATLPPDRRLSPESNNAGRSAATPSKRNRGADAGGPGAPFFLPPVMYDPGGTGFSAGFFSVAVADVNGDGKPDLLVSNYYGCAGCANGSVGVLLGNGDGTFQSAVTYDSGAPHTESLVVADVNGDGKLDVVVGNDCGGCSFGGVAALLGNGDGTFQPAVTCSNCTGGVNSIAVADINGDDKVDIATLVICAGLHCPGGDGVAGVLLGLGDGTFQDTGGTYNGGNDTGGTESVSLAVADVSGDGKTYILVANRCSLVGRNCVGAGSVGLLLGKGNGYFQPVVSYSDVGSPSDVVIADVNGDGKPDLVLATNAALGVLLGNGDGSFQSMITYPADARKIEVAGVNGDGKLDVVGANYDGSVSVLLGNGDGTFRPVVTQPEGYLMSITTADLRGDGRLDLVVGTTNADETKPLATTTSSLASSPNPALIHEVVTYTATVVSQFGGAITGTVMFQDGSTTVATVTVAGNQAAYSAQYNIVGVHAITATYSGDANNTGSTSATLMEQINKGFASKTVLITSGSPSHAGQPVTFTATVTSKHGVIPDGEVVAFSDGTTTMGTGTTTSGVATCTTSSLSVKTHKIKTAYGGDATFEPSFGKVTQVVEP
jgi:hypothetical protein